MQIESFEMSPKSIEKRNLQKIFKQSQSWKQYIQASMSS